MGVATALLAREAPTQAIEVLDVAEELEADNAAVLGAWPSPPARAPWGARHHLP